MSIIPVGRRSEMVGQIFRLANDQLHQPDADSAYMTSGDSQSPLPSDAVKNAAPVVKDATGAAADAAGFHDLVYKELENLGIDPRIISRKSNSLIKFEEDIASGKMSGSFLIPVELPTGGTVSHDKAKEIALKIFDKFGLKGKIGRDERRKFHVISFSTKEAEASKPTNEGSFGNLPDNEAEKKTSTASVQSEMFLTRKSMLIDALRKGGYIR